MDRLNEHLVHLIMQFFKEQNRPSLSSLLESESGVLFNVEQFGKHVSEGQWDFAEKYLSKFTKHEDNHGSRTIFFRLGQQKYLEAWAKGDAEEALNILNNELQVFKVSHNKSFAKLMKISKVKHFRERILASEIEDIKVSRTVLLEGLVRLISVNPKLQPKLELPNIKKSGLLTMIKQSLDWQHMQCKNPRSIPEFTSLFVDHSCDQPQAPSSVPALSVGFITNADASPPIDPITVPLPLTQTSVSRWMAGQTPPGRPSVPSQSLSKSRPVRAGQRALPIKRKSAAGNRNATSRRASKRRIEEEVEIIQQDQNPRQNELLLNDLPLTVVESLSHDSTVISMDFHPVHHGLLLVGTATGNVYIWDLSSKNILVQKSFELWDIETCSMYLQVSMADGSSPAVTRVKWSSDGAHFGVSYTKHIVQVYSYHGNGNLSNYLEIEADRGRVHDVAFTDQNNELWVITCGDEMVIKVWDSYTGLLKFRFEGHEAPVCSIFPQQFADHQSIFSADIGGTIKIWLYDETRCRFNIPTPQHVMANIAFSADGPRMFIGGTNGEGESCIVELSVTNNSIKLAYDGLVKPSVGYVQYDIAKGKYLAAVDAYMVKFWDVDHTNLLNTTDADGGIHPSGCIKFNKEGTFLAVTTKDNGIKILANAAGQRFLHTLGKRVLDASRTVQVPNVNVVSTFLETVVPGRSVSLSPNVMINNGSFSMFDGNRTMAEEPLELPNSWILKEINDVSQCCSVRIHNKFSRKSVSWLAYTKSGRAILVLGSNGEHRLWEWPKTAQNSKGKATASCEPKLWQAPDNMQMVNDVGYTNTDGPVSCFALPKNRHYVLSASGGTVSVYDIINFKRLATIMPPPPAATSLAIHPKDSNTLVLGMEDSSIRIYQFRTRKVVSEFIGHSKRVTGLTFSDVLNVLVSSGADSQLCIWSTDEWTKVGNTFLQVPPERASDTRVQFHKDQIWLMAVHKTQIAIYRAPELIRLNKWVPQDASSLITHAAYSCDCESIFVAFGNGSVGVLTASSLVLKCRINPTSFIPPNVRSKPFPHVVAAHPSEPNQFALGLSDGMVVLLEPLEKDGMWGTPPVRNEAGPSATPGVTDLDQLIWEEENM